MRTLKVVLVIVISQVFAVSNTHAQNFTLRRNPIPPPDGVMLVYFPDVGSYSVRAGENVKITTWEHKDMGGLFNCDNLAAGALPGLFDVCNGDKLFKLEPDGFSEIDFGNLLPPGMGVREVAQLGMINGSLLAGGEGGRLDALDPDSPYIFDVPEPSSAVILSGALGLFWFRRRRR